MPIPVKGKLHFYEVETDLQYLYIPINKLEQYWRGIGLAQADDGTLEGLLDEWESE